MTAALETVYADGVAADGLGLQRMAHRRALVDNLDPGLFQGRHPALRVVAGRLDHLHAAVDDRLDVAGVVRRRDRGQERQVHAERLVGHCPAAGDLLGQVLRRALGETCDQSQPPRVGNRRGQFREADEVHAALDDRVLNAEQFGDASLHAVSWSGPPVRSGHRRRRFAGYVSGPGGTRTRRRCPSLARLSQRRSPARNITLRRRETG